MHLLNYFSRLHPRSISRRQAFLLRAAVSIAAFAVLWAVSDLRKAAALVARADPALVATAIALLAIPVPLMAWRWKIILANMGAQVGLGSLMRTLCVSAFFGVGLPSASGNDLVRGAMLKRPDIPLRVVIASVLTDRLLGVLTLAFLALPGSALFLFEARGSRIMQLVMAASATLILATLGVLLALPYIARKFSLPSPAAKSFIARPASAAASGAQAFSHGSILACMLLSFVSQGIAILSVVCVGAALHTGEPVEMYFAFVPVVWIVTMLPITISGLGVREASFGFLFQAVGYSYEHGIAIGAIASATGIIAAMLGGLALLTASGRKRLDSQKHAGFSLPLLVVAGMPRTGTTTIYRNLERHPGFETPLRKELNHFLHEAPPRTYRDYFPHWEQGKICVDISPFYSLDPEAARRLRREVPHARVVLLVREPADWIRSVYAQTCSFVRRPPSFVEFIASPWMPFDGRPMHFSLAGGLYARTISCFAQAFGDRLAVVDFAALERDPTAILQEIERFAGAAPYFDERTVDSRRNNSSDQARSSFPLARNLLQREFVIRAGLAVVPASLLRRVRAWLYYSSSEPRDASPHVAPDPRNLDIARAATHVDREYYAALFNAAAIRCGSQLI